MKKLFLAILILNNLAFAEEIFLSATKEGLPQNFLPSNTVVITKEEIQKTNAKNVGEVIDMLTTIEVGHYATLGSLKNLRLRNSTAEQVLILLDGVPISGVGKGAFNLSLIPTEVVEKIEIIQGSCSALYGANTVAGVVNIITKKAKQTKPTLDINSSYGDFTTYVLNTNFDYNAQDFSINGCVSSKHSDGWRENSEYNSLSGYVNFSLPIYIGKLVLNTLINTSKLGVPGPAVVPISGWDGEKEKKASTPFAKQYDDLYFLSLGYQSQIFDSKVVYNRQELLYDNSKDQFWPDKTNSELLTLSFLNTLSLPYKFFVSLNFDWTQIDQQYPLSPTDNFKKDVSNLGVVLQKNFQYEKLSFIPTIRWDSNSLFGNKVSPQIMFAYNFVGTKLSISVGSSWRAPTFLDLYWPNQIWIKGNPNLKPEESYSLDFGVEHKFAKNFLVKLNPFYRYIKDQIRWYPEDPSNPWSAWVPSNVDEAIVQGAELTFEFLPTKIFNNKLNVLISDNRIKKKGEEDKGWQKQAYSPLVSAVLYSELSLPYEISLVNNIKYTDTQYSKDAEGGTKLDSFILWNLKLEKRLLNILNIYFQVNDLLDKKGVNRVGYPQPGRTYEVGAQVNISL